MVVIAFPVTLHIAYVTAVILFAIALYGSQLVICNSGSLLAKQASSTGLLYQSYCSPGQTPNPRCREWLDQLQPIIRTLVKNGEISVRKHCQIDKHDQKLAYCTVWVWYIPRKLMVDDPKLIESIKKSSPKPSPGHTRGVLNSIKDRIDGKTR